MLWIAILASFVSFLDGSVINVALPAISRELGGGLTTQQWVVDAYLITLGSLILVAGSLSDLLGRVVVLRAGLVGFGATSVMCALAPTADWLVLARALQGVAGALLVPSFPGSDHIKLRRSAPGEGNRPVDCRYNRGFHRGTPARRSAR
ncbi:MFS transporter [Arthrobacter sp. NicSoilC12]|uniref:MFS transporter n=1 Tax=Arthrobacter sp. NicSoilC12 TaxID=2831001 RepID=UPI00207EDE1B|nr:hypothetical protein NicSoilC12_26850 [Arthrobacter sp. NicSoilC12]